MTYDNRLLGILGGLGPMSTVYFYETITRHTKAARDQEHLDILISSRATTPDRTAFIKGQSQESPLEAMLEEGRRLEKAGASLIAMPCNTAHFFYEALSSALGIPVLNIVEETVAYLHALGVSRVGILATDGTIQSGLFDRALETEGVPWMHPDESEQRTLMHLIYGVVKASRPMEPARESWEQILDGLRARGADLFILGCTELPVLSGALHSKGPFLDPTEELAKEAIRFCGYQIKS